MTLNPKCPSNNSNDSYDDDDYYFYSIFYYYINIHTDTLPNTNLRNRDPSTSLFRVVGYDFGMTLKPTINPKP